MKAFLPLLLLIGLVPARAADPAPTGITAAQSFPYSMIGQLVFNLGNFSFVGTGTLVQPRGVITAAHNLYDPQAGWATDVVYRRGHYGPSDLTKRRPTRLYILAGYQANTATYGPDSLQAFNRDTGGLKFLNDLAGGAFLETSSDLSLLTGFAPKTALGYGGVVHSGERLLASPVSNPFHASYLNFYESNNLGIEGGMSGGPVICIKPNGDPVVAATVVSAADVPVLGGVRYINTGVLNFISSYLSSATP